MASKYLRVLSAAALALTIASLPAAANSAAPKAELKSPKCGGASWYALTSRTASGERMNAGLLTAAHRSLKFGTKLLVTNMRNGKSVVVRINDRGPFHRSRVLDVSKAAAADIGMVSSGTARVCYTIVG
jgi:rare lipoprotein A|nr:septal ring lytic transglycosylase RlpA family protein [Neorhizobium tomejilense]